MQPSLCKSIYTEPAPQLHSLVSLKNKAATGSEKASKIFMGTDGDTENTLNWPRAEDWREEVPLLSSQYIMQLWI